MNDHGCHSDYANDNNGCGAYGNDENTHCSFITIVLFFLSLAILKGELQSKNNLGSNKAITLFDCSQIISA